MEEGWIGVDLDGTLAVYDHWRGIEHIGEPVAKMVERVKAWLAEGRRVKIFTARVCEDGGAREAEAARAYIEAWSEKHIGRVLEVTNIKDFAMLELYDDRVRQVMFNTGELVEP